MYDKVLDTLKFKNEKIFLKEFHVQRSFEACQLVNSKTLLSEVSDIYDQLEKQFHKEAEGAKMLRLVFNPQDLLNFEVAVIAKSVLSEIITLELMSKALQPHGLGTQNYKWTHRNLWDQILKEKNPKADDVICINSKNEVT